MDYLLACFRSRIAIPAIIVGLLASVIYVGLRLAPDQGFETIIKVSTIGVGFVGLISIILLAEQIRLTDYRASRVAYHEYFDYLPKQDSQTSFEALVHKYGIQGTFTSGSPIDSATCAKIFADDADSRCMRQYLDDFEEFAGAVKCGVVDQAYAFTLEGSRTIRAYTVFKPLILKYRKEMAELPTCYVILEWLAERWKDKKSKQIKKIQRLTSA